MRKYEAGPVGVSPSLWLKPSERGEEKMSEWEERRNLLPYGAGKQTSDSYDGEWTGVRQRALLLHSSSSTVTHQLRRDGSYEI